MRAILIFSSSRIDDDYIKILENWLSIFIVQHHIIKALASSKGMSVNAYMQDLVRKDQCGLFDTMQIAEKNSDMISGITGNMHDGYDIIFKDDHSCHCRTKKEVRSCIIEYCNEKGD